MTLFRDFYRIVLAEDHVGLRGEVKSLIDGTNGQKVVGEAGDGAELLELLIYQPCEMIILDLGMPNMNGFEALDHLRKAYRHIAVIILTTHRDPSFLKRSLTSGAVGYIFKEEVHTMLPKVIGEVRSGKQVIGLPGDAITPGYRAAMG